MARRLIRRMFIRTIAAGAGRQPADQIHRGKEFNKIARSHRRGFHEILPRIAGKAGAHEHVQHIMHMQFGRLQRQITAFRQCPRQVRMAAMMILSARQQVMGIGVAAGANHVMHTAAKGVKAKGVVSRSDIVSDAIIAAAKKHKADLVVMASHGRKGIKRLLLGSETQQVLTHCHVPVLVLR